MINTILIDFDGVIRHWNSANIEELSATLGVDKNTVFLCAFSERYLIPAITGRIYHREWSDLVEDELSESYDTEIATRLVKEWYESSFEIDCNFLEQIRIASKNTQLILVTNATNRLDSDLERCGLVNAFDQIVNSSEIGVAKPDNSFFEITLNSLGVQTKECIFIDDTLANVEAAEALGILSLQHTNVEDTLAFIASSLEHA